MEKINLKIKKNNLLNERIESERLLLVPISMKFCKDIFDEFTEEISIYMFPAPAKNISETEEFITNSINELGNNESLQMVILNKESGEFLGCGGLHHVDRKTPELGIWLKKSAHGSAYGREAMTALKKWADKNLAYDYLLYPVADANIASRKIPESLGGKIVKEYDDKGLGGNEYHTMEYRIYPEKK